MNGSAENHELVELLEKTDAFARFSTSEIESFLEICHRERYEEDELVFVEGNPGDAMYILLDGEVGILKRLEGSSEEGFVRLTPLHGFGEMGFISDDPRSITARCRTEAELLVIPKISFDRKLQGEDLSALKFVTNIAIGLARRLSEADSALVKLREELQKSDQDVGDWLQHDLITVQKILLKGLTDQE